MVEEELQSSRAARICDQPQADSAGVNASLWKVLVGPRYRGRTGQFCDVEHGFSVSLDRIRIAAMALAGVRQ
jgi:hypothetical protein